MEPGKSRSPLLAHINIVNMRLKSKPSFSVLFLFFYAREHSSSVVECLTRDRGPRARASPALLCCVTEQYTFFLA